MFCFCLGVHHWSDCSYAKSLCASHGRGQSEISLPGQDFSLPEVSVLVKLGVPLGPLSWPALQSVRCNCVSIVDSFSGVCICKIVSFRGLCAWQL